jgi:Protein of unknown function (DUF3617)
MMKTIPSTALLAAVVLTLAVAPLSAADRMVPGMWEFTSTTNGETNTFKHCVTSAEVETVNGDAKSGRINAAKESKGDCRITDYRVFGNAVAYEMVCGKTSTHSKAAYHGDAFEATVTTKAEGAPDVVNHIKARRLGACP